MAVPLMKKKSFLRSGEPKIASYDWYDFASNIGYKNFYATGGYDDAAKSYFLSPVLISSDEENCKLTIGATTTELNFDITFNKPVTIAAADAYITFFLYHSGILNSYLQAILYHVAADTTETSIGGDTSNSLVTAGADTYYKCFKFTLTKKHFAKGEKLRLSLLYTGGGNFCTLFYDAETSQELSITVPFIVNL